MSYKVTFNLKILSTSHKKSLNSSFLNEPVFQWPFHSSVSYYMTLEVQYKLFTAECNLGWSQVPGKSRGGGLPLPAPFPNFILKLFHF